jgi:hypothetical protein
MTGADEKRRGRRVGQRKAVDEETNAGRARVDAKPRRARLELRDGDDRSAAELTALADLGDVRLVRVDGRLWMKESLLRVRQVVDDGRSMMLAVRLLEEAARTLVVATLIEANALGEVSSSCVDVVRACARSAEQQGKRDTVARAAQGFAMPGLGVPYVLKSVLLLFVSPPFGLRPIEPPVAGTPAGVPSV